MSGLAGGRSDFPVGGHLALPALQRFAQRIGARHADQLGTGMLLQRSRVFAAADVCTESIVVRHRDHPPRTLPRREDNAAQHRINRHVVSRGLVNPAFEVGRDQARCWDRQAVVGLFVGPAGRPDRYALRHGPPVRVVGQRVVARRCAGEAITRLLRRGKGTVADRVRKVQHLDLLAAWAVRAGPVEQRHVVAQDTECVAVRAHVFFAESRGASDRIRLQSPYENADAGLRIAPGGVDRDRPAQVWRVRQAVERAAQVIEQARIAQIDVAPPSPMRQAERLRLRK